MFKILIISNESPVLDSFLSSCSPAPYGSSYFFVCIFLFRLHSLDISIESTSTPAATLQSNRIGMCIQSAVRNEFLNIYLLLRTHNIKRYATDYHNFWFFLIHDIIQLHLIALNTY